GGGGGRGAAAAERVRLRGRTRSAVSLAGGRRDGRAAPGWQAPAANVPRLLPAGGSLLLDFAAGACPPGTARLPVAALAKRPAATRNPSPRWGAGPGWGHP